MVAWQWWPCVRLIAEKSGRTDKYDSLRFLRGDGSETRTSMPRQGTLPHDLVHYVVESALPLQHGFLSLVAAGTDASFVMQAMHEPGSQRVETEAVQAEAVVEALQAQLWSGCFDKDAFLEGVDSASAARGKPAFDFSGIDPRALLYDRALALLERWNEVPFHEAMELVFDNGKAGAVDQVPAAHPGRDPCRRWKRHSSDLHANRRIVPS